MIKAQISQTNAFCKVASAPLKLIQIDQSQHRSMFVFFWKINNTILVIHTKLWQFSVSLAECCAFGILSFGIQQKKIATKPLSHPKVNGFGASSREGNLECLPASQGRGNDFFRRYSLWAPAKGLFWLFWEGMDGRCIQDFRLVRLWPQGSYKQFSRIVPQPAQSWRGTTSNWAKFFK